MTQKIQHGSCNSEATSLRANSAEPWSPPPFFPPGKRGDRQACTLGITYYINHPSNTRGVALTTSAIRTPVGEFFIVVQIASDLGLGIPRRAVHVARVGPTEKSATCSSNRRHSNTVDLLGSRARYHRRGPNGAIHHFQILNPSSV